MMKRKYPLFVCDMSRTHGREERTDYISCTSNELPFVAAVTFITESQYLKEYDRDNDKVIYDKGRNNCRIRIEVLDIREGYDKTQLRNLLTRALKEYVTRFMLTTSNSCDVSLNNKISFIEEMIKQGREQKRENPGNPIITESLRVLESILNDYETRIEETSTN